MSASDHPLLVRFQQHLWLERGLSAHTRSAYLTDLALFDGWLRERGSELARCDRDHLLEYLDWRAQAHYHPRSTARLLSCLRNFYGYCRVEGLLSNDPTLQVMQARQSRAVPHSLSEAQVEALLAAPDTGEALGLRDRAMLEVLYACGLRVSELVALTTEQIDLRQGLLQVGGPGLRSRLVPLGEVAADWLVRYLREARGELLLGRPSDVLFPSRRGEQMTRQTFWHRIKRHAQTAGIEQSLSPHTLRHAFATHLLNHGAELRVVQILLGHREPTSTQIYAQIAEARLERLQGREPAP
ncbi:site-specific tyrosine recombinase XerD [Pseudomonas sp. NW5]|uniref:site-specific tyrosine recombinase XerD n=1 Tax=Pseudomonas sp. NW5 TaxID=2934934 RepID=UPI002020DC04|nr:site-specific tyrosine recombinase XerD [Pseudomonas sp. NW5]MCL7462447.1 site-specific tyrosine recombinase XerD [Pseudomonas sp. NW5]